MCKNNKSKTYYLNLNDYFIANEYLEKQLQISQSDFSVQNYEEQLVEWQILQESRLEIEIIEYFNQQRNEMLLRFDDVFEAFYTKSMNNADDLFLDQKKISLRFEKFGFFNFKSYEGFNLLKQNAPEIEIISQINTDPLADKIKLAQELALLMGGQAGLYKLNIPLSFKLRDPIVEKWLSEYAIQLSDKVGSQISSTIKYEILEGIQNYESIPQIKSRILKVWNDPIDVVVPPKYDEIGNVIRQGYSYKLKPNEWADIVARTEVNRAFNQGRLLAYKQSSVVSTVMFSTTPDERLCTICAGMDGMIFKIEESFGIIPVHPRCRCTWFPNVNISDYDSDRINRDLSILYGQAE